MRQQQVKVCIQTLGTRGDIQPYLAAARALTAANYEVTMLTNANFGDVTAEATSQVKFRGVFFDISSEMSSERAMRAMRDGDVESFTSALNAMLDDNAATNVRDWYQAIREIGPDVLVSGTLCEFYSIVAMYHLKIPTIFVRPSNVDLVGDRRMIWGLPSLPCGLNASLLRWILLQFYRGWKRRLNGAALQVTTFEPLKWYTEDNFLEDLSSSPLADTLVSMPEEVAKALYPGQSSGYRYVGYMILHDYTSPTLFGDAASQRRLETFVEASTEPCAYLGWGSMSFRSPAYMTTLVVRVLRRTGLRAVISRGWAGLALENLDDPDLLAYAADRALFVDTCPHEWLFPKCAVLVHHGGAGTTGAALRSGTPQVITPVFMDQFDSAFAVNALGVGVGFDKKQLRNIKAEDLAAAITTCVSNPSYKAKAAALAPKIRAQDGAASLVGFVDEFWTDHVLTGRFLEAIDRRLEQRRSQLEDEEIPWYRRGCF